MGVTESQDRENSGLPPRQPVRWLTCSALLEVQERTDAFPLAALQAAVGGYVEVVHLDRFPGGPDLWVNEEGLLNGLPLNVWATSLVRQFGRDPNAVIVGDVALTGCVDREGETMPLAVESAAALHQAVHSEVFEVARLAVTILAAEVVIVVDDR